MKVEIHKLFEYLLETVEQDVEAVIGFSLSALLAKGLAGIEEPRERALAPTAK